LVPGQLAKRAWFDSYCTNKEEEKSIAIKVRGFFFVNHAELAISSYKYIKISFYRLLRSKSGVYSLGIHKRGNN